VQEVGPDQLALLPREIGMRSKGVFHIVGAGFEFIQEIPMAPLKVLKDIGQLTGCPLRIERHDSVDDMIRTSLVGWIEVPRFGRRLERTHDDPRGIGVEIKSLSVQECGL
jgi:hypothetical protein